MKRYWIYVFCASFVALMFSGCFSLHTSFSANGTQASLGATVQLSWTASTGSPAGYKVEQSSDNVNFIQIQMLTNANTITSQVSGLSWNKVYYFRMRAYNSVGNSPYSSTVSILTVSSR